MRAPNHRRHATAGGSVDRSRSDLMLRMKVIFFGALVLGVLMSRTASAQTCPHGTAPVTGTLEVADGSTHDPNEVPLVQAVAAAGVFLQERYGWGSQTFCLGGPPEGMH